MGDGKKLKEYLDEKGTNVRRIAKATGICATTVYRINLKDSVSNRSPKGIRGAF